MKQSSSACLPAYPNRSAFLSVSESWRTPRPLNMARKEVDLIANQLATRLGFWPGDSVHGVAKALGGSVASIQDGGPSSYSLEVRPRSFTIQGEEDSSNHSSRMALAQDLGHVVLHVMFANQHRDAGITHLRTDRNALVQGHEEQARREARWFAASLLMPATVFRQVFSDLKGELAQVASRFRVPVTEVRSRAMALGLLATK